MRPGCDHQFSELLHLGYKVPDDVTVIGFGDFSAARQITPTLTTVRLPGRDMGRAALRLLMDRIRLGTQNLESAQRLYIVPQIVERNSSGPSPSRQHDKHGLIERAKKAE